MLWDLVRYDVPSSVGSSLGTVAGTFIRFCVRVSIESGIGPCGVPQITFGDWIGVNLGATLRHWVVGMVGDTLGA